MQKLLALVGPTAIGKTSLAIKLAQEINAEIISGDSMQVYREVSIGTAKANAKEQKLVKHYLVDQKSIFDSYSVKEFVDEAQKAANQISAKGKLPFVVGGTGFYLYSLLYNLKLGEQKEYQDHISSLWQNFLRTNGAEKLWLELNKVDPAAASKIPYQNTRRVLRALTVIERSGKKFSQLQAVVKPRYDYLLLGLNSDRQKIYDRINQRVDQMVADGIVAEAQMVYQNRAQVQQLLQAIAYKEFFPYFAGQKDLQSCIADLKKNSRHYAKRQLTYFRNKLDVHWFDPIQDDDCLNKMLELIRKWQDE